jgi:RNase P subunit RPR2
MKKLPKEETKKEIETFFKNIKNKNPKDIKKIKKIAMRQNIKLGGKRKLFCKKCYTPYKKPKIRIKIKIKTIECENCKYMSRWNI